jgi:hypothetical protein
MNAEKSIEIIRELRRGNECLAAAKSLYEGGFFEDALSRSYYAVFHGAKSLLLAKGLTGRSHEAVKQLFGLHFVKSREFGPEYASIFRREQDDRLLADYDVAFEPDAARAGQRIADAERFLNAVAAYLEKSRIDPATSLSIP